MKRVVFSLIGLMLFTTSCAFAQVGVPVAEIEMRDSTSLRMRAIQLERVKREASKPSSKEPNKADTIRLAKIKDDFEHIQKLQTEIVQAYATGKQINYQKINESAADMNKRAVRLEANLFNLKETREQTEEPNKQLSVRGLIIDLDAAIADFVDSPIFKNIRVVEKKETEKSQAQLVKIIQLSEALSREAKKML